MGDGNAANVKACCRRPKTPPPPAFCRSPLDAEPGGQVGSVSVRDVGVLPQEHRDLLVRVQPDPARHQHRPVLVTSQFNVVGRLGTLLGLLGHG